jgi:hypothetical protein
VLGRAAHPNTRSLVTRAAAEREATHHGGQRTGGGAKREALLRTEAHLAAIPSERTVAAIVGHGQNTDIQPSRTERG